MVEHPKSVNPTPLFRPPVSTCISYLYQTHLINPLYRSYRGSRRPSRRAWPPGSRTSWRASRGTCSPKTGTGKAENIYIWPTQLHVAHYLGMGMSKRQLQYCLHITVSCPRAFWSGDPSDPFNHLWNIWNTFVSIWNQWSGIIANHRRPRTRRESSWPCRVRCRTKSRRTAPTLRCWDPQVARQSRPRWITRDKRLKESAINREKR